MNGEAHCLATKMQKQWQKNKASRGFQVTTHSVLLERAVHEDEEHFAQGFQQCKEGTQKISVESG